MTVRFNTVDVDQAGVTAIDELRFQPTLLTADPHTDFERAKQAAKNFAKAHARLTSREGQHHEF